MPDTPSHNDDLFLSLPKDRLPDLQPRLPPVRPTTLLLGCLPSGGLASPPAGRSGRPHPVPLATPTHRLRVPSLRNPLPRRATLPRLQHLRPSARSGWSLPTLRRTRRPRRSLLGQHRYDWPITHRFDRHAHPDGADLSGLLLSRRLAHLLFGAHTALCRRRAACTSPLAWSSIFRSYGEKSPSWKSIPRA
jgi:hypothetical protein